MPSWRDVCGAKGHSPAMIEEHSVPTLARLCGEETARYLRHEPYAERYCLELFRRAVEQRDDDAWAAVYTQYAAVVRRWLHAAPADGDEIVSVAFERFWRAVDAAKFARFGSLPAVLQYLKMCAVTARLDAARSARSTAAEEPLGEEVQLIGDGASVEDAVSSRAGAQDLWRTVQGCLNDERERLTVYLSCVVGMSPRDICARHPEQFPDVAEVYRLKRNVLDRLRRMPEIKALL